VHHSLFYSASQFRLCSFSFLHFFFGLGDDDKLAGLFWADEEAIKDYAIFGDIVSFDATFRSNKYDFLLMLF
jgi:hypothetical protein